MKSIYPSGFTTLLLISCFTLPISGSLIQNSEGWSHQLDFEKENGIRIKWKNSASEDEDGHRWLTMQVSAKTKGYVGVGFSPHGGMAGADIVIGWVDSNGKTHLKDYHALANEQPILDKKQDYELIHGSENEDRTTIEFRRRWETCDENDMAIVNDTMRLIWAYSPFDPKLGDDSSIVTNLQWHGTNTRGAASVYVIEEALLAKFPDENDPHVKTWDVLMTDNVIDAEYTTYFCKILKFPTLEKKHHMIGFKPVIVPENKKNVHHITMYECVIPPVHGKTSDVFEKHLDNEGGRCFTPNMPPEWGKYCVTFLFVWVSGSEGEMLPDHVGIPLGEEHNGATYFMLEMHYDNPELRSFKDTSGVQIYYTDKLRPNDGSVLLTGFRLTPFMLLPPLQENFEINGICSPECTQNAIPKEGINIISTLVHAHLSGRKIRLRQFRNGKELPMIAKDNHYDFNYQQSRAMKEEIKIMPGDQLMVECEYDTTNYNRIVLGGLSTTQEMCQTFVMYYPRIDLMQCTSQYEYEDFFKGLGIDEVSGSILKDVNMPYNPHLQTPEEQLFEPLDDVKELEETGDGASFKSMFDAVMIERPEHLKRSYGTVGNYLKLANWTDKTLGLAKKVEQSWKDGKHYAFCTGHGRRRVPLENYVMPYPKILEPLQEENSICDKDEASNIISYSEPGTRWLQTASSATLNGFSLQSNLPILIFSINIFHYIWS